MKVSSPIPQLLLVIATNLQDEELFNTIMEELEKIETSNTETNSRILDESFSKFVKELSENKLLMSKTSGFASIYMFACGNQILGECFANVCLI